MVRIKVRSVNGLSKGLYIPGFRKKDHSFRGGGAFGRMYFDGNNRIYVKTTREDRKIVEIRLLEGNTVPFEEIQNRTNVEPDPDSEYLSAALWVLSNDVGFLNSYLKDYTDIAEEYGIIELAEISEWTKRTISDILQERLKRFAEKVSTPSSV